MKHKYFMPPAIAAYLLWLINFRDQIAIKGPGLGYTGPQITAIQLFCTLQIDAIQAAEQTAKDAEQANSDRDAIIKTNATALRNEIQDIKTKTGYDEGVGKSLDIIGSEITIDFDTVKTIAKVKKTQDGVDIKFTKEHCEGGRIYCMRGKETEFTFLATVTHPHYIDTRPNADDNPSEVRKYKVVLVFHDHAVGLDSDIAEITV